MDSIQRIKEFIMSKNISQSEMADLLGTSTSQLNRWLRRRCKPTKIWEKVIQEKLEMLELER